MIRSRASQRRPSVSARAQGLLDGIGGTPLIELTELLPRARSRHARLFAKLESTNPGGSIKDRPVARMLLRALDEGALDGGRHVLDSTSGNAGIAYALIGAALGLPVTLVVPGNASRERLERIRAHGAELVLTDPIEGYDHAINEARRLAREEPERYWYADQYSNDENWRAHEEGTGAEILADLSARRAEPPALFVAGVGTGGTLTGVGRRLRRANERLRIAAVVPETFPGIEGLKPLGHEGDLVPAILDEASIDVRVPMELERAADMARRLAQLGLFVGPSSGAYVAAALELAERGADGTLVTVLPDGGGRYGSTGLWAAALGSRQP